MTALRVLVSAMRRNLMNRRLIQSSILLLVVNPRVGQHQLAGGRRKYFADLADRPLHEGPGAPRLRRNAARQADDVVLLLE